MPGTEITEPIKFLGGTVVSFNANIGYNSAASTLNVTLVEDTDDGDLIDLGGNFPGQGNNPGKFVIFSLPNSYYDSPADNVFDFGGLITNIKKTVGINGTFFQVTISDPRVLFRQVPIITNIFNQGGQFQNQNIIDHMGRFAGDIIQGGVSPDGVSWTKLYPSVEEFVGNFHGFTCKIQFDQSFQEYIPNNYVVKLENPTLEDLITTVARENSMDLFVAAVQGTGVDAFARIYGISRRDQNALNITQFQQFRTERAGRVRDWEQGRELRQDPNNIVIWGENIHTLYNNVCATIPSAQSSVNSNSIIDLSVSPSTFNPLSDRAPNSPPVEQCPGGLPFSNANVVCSCGVDFQPIALFERFDDGNYTDRPFVSLEKLESVDTQLISTLPQWPFERKILSINVPGNPAQPIYFKTRQYIERPGYFVNEEILRAALHNKLSWAACVWYTYKDLVKQVEILSYPAIDRFDAYDSLAEHIIDAFNPDGSIKDLVDILDPAFVQNLHTLPEHLGIHSPNFWRDDPNACDPNLYSRSTLLGDPTDESEALQEAVYQATVKAAETYYGKTFIVALPASEIMSDVIENGSVYQYLRKRNKIEYEVTDAGWHEEDPDGDGVLEDPIPAKLKNSESSSFQTDDGRLKGMARILNTKLKSINIDIAENPDCGPRFGDTEIVNQPDPDNTQLATDVDLSNFDGSKLIKINVDNPNSNDPVNTELPYYMYTPDIQIEQFLFDPRFAIITLSNPFIIGHDVIRKLDVVDENGIPIAGPPAYRLGRLRTAADGWENFFSWMYETFDIASIEDSYLFAIHGRPGKITDTLYHKDSVGNPVAFNLIREDHYYIGMRDGKYQCEENFNMAPRRYTTDYCTNLVFDWYAPLRWNFKRYGPFRGDFLQDVGGTQVINDASLTPWKYGNAVNMTSIGDAQAAASEAANSIIETASMSVEGFPELALGSALGINSTLSNVSLSFGTDGVVTTYKFKTFSGPTAFQKKQDFDNVSRFSNFEKEAVDVDKILKAIVDSKKEKTDNEKINTIGTTLEKKAIATANQDRIVATSNGLVQLKSASNTSQDIRKGLEDYGNLHIAALNDIFQPYTTDQTRAPDLQGVDARIAAFHNTEDVTKLNPFIGSSGFRAPPTLDNCPTDYVQQFDGSNIRSIGWRLPAIGVGWGYDIYGKPAPSGHEDQTKFINNRECGGTVPTSGYLAGPIDFRWDPRRSVWSIGSDVFFAKITDFAISTTDQNPSAAVLQYYKYGWVEVDFDSEGHWHTVPNTSLKAIADGPSGAWNFKQMWADATPNVVGGNDKSFHLGLPAPSGTIVQMRAYANKLPSDAEKGTSLGEDELNKYIFEYDQEFFLARIEESAIWDTEKPHYYKWKYKFIAVYWDEDAEDFIDTNAIENNIEENYAINLVEWNNPDCELEDCCGATDCCGEEVACEDCPGCIINPGVNICGCDYPEGFEPQPISPGTIVNMRVLAGNRYNNESNLGLRHRYCFEAYNAHDGLCAEEKEG